MCVCVYACGWGLWMSNFCKWDTLHENVEKTKFDKWTFLMTESFQNVSVQNMHNAFMKETVSWTYRNLSEFKKEKSTQKVLPKQKKSIKCANFRLWDALMFSWKKIIIDNKKPPFFQIHRNFLKHKVRRMLRYLANM